MAPDLCVVMVTLGADNRYTFAHPYTLTTSYPDAFQSDPAEVRVDLRTQSQAASVYLLIRVPSMFDLSFFNYYCCLWLLLSLESPALLFVWRFLWFI
jgi:hypothetical protein